MTTHDPSLVADPAPRALLRAHDRAAAAMADLPPAPPLGPALPRDRIPPILAGGTPPRPPRAGLWGTTALVVIALAWGLATVIGTITPPPVDEAQAAASSEAEDMAGPVEAEDVAAAEEEPVEVVVQPVLVAPEQLPQRVQEQLAAAAAAAEAAAEPTPIEEVLPDTPPEPLPEPLPETVPEHLPDPVSVPAPEPMPPLAAEIAPEASALPDDPADIPPPYTGAVQDGVPMAAISLVGAESRDQVGGWINEGLVELWVKTNEGTFIARPGAEGTGGLLIDRAEATTGGEFKIRYDGGQPPVMGEAALAVAITQATAKFIRVDEVMLVLTPQGRAAVDAAQARAVTAVTTLGRMPADVTGLDLTLCLDALTREAALAAVKLAGTGELLPVGDEC